MGLIRHIIFIIITVLGPVALAVGPLTVGDMNDLASAVALQSLCKKGINNCNTEQKKTINQLIWNCQVQIKNNQCEDLAKKNPAWAPLMKKCSFDKICQESYEYQTKKAIACARGYKNALVDTGVAIKDMAVSGAEMISGSWKKFLASNKNREIFLKECDKTLECKRELAASLFPDSKMNDSYLSKTSAKSLWQSQLMSRDFELRRIDRIAQSNNVENLQASIAKIKKLKEMVSSSVAKQYNRYSCYTELAKEELECYAIGTVVDPTLVAGYFTKGVRAAVAIKELSAASKAAENTARATEVASVAAKETLKRSPVPVFKRPEFIKSYLNFNPTTVAQNEKWMALAGKGSSKNTVFFDVENSQLKMLNDKLKEKNFVTSLTNYHKDLTFKKMQELVKNNPGLQVDMYSDFKSSRFAFSGKIPKDLEQQLKKVFDDANKEFTEAVKANKMVRDSDAPEKWFRAGVGNSADEANLAARYSRQQQNNELQSFSSSELKKSVQTKINGLNAQRKALQAELANTSMVSGKSFDTDVFDIIRKNEGSLANTREALKVRYGLSKLSSSTVSKLQRYVKGADEFSPGIHVSQRVVANFDQAVQGGLSADIIGMGGANLKGTADALAGVSDVGTALASTRAGEKAVTVNFNKQKKYFEQVIKDSVPAGKLRTVCSGDDCVAVAVKPLNTAEKELIVKRLANSDYSGSYRLAFVSDGIKNPEVRNNLATHGESVEKILRKSLGTQMEPRKLKGLTFAVDMQTKEMNRGNLKLILGNSDNAKLSATERKLVEAEFAKAVQTFNRDLIKAGTKNPAYRATP